MAKKKRSRLAQDLKSFAGVVGGNPRRVYQGERPGDPDPRVARAIAKRAARAASKITVELRQYAEAYAGKRNHADAWMLLHPNCPTLESARRQGWRTMQKIREHLTESEIYDLLGLSREAITTAIADALGATSQKDFILPKTGRIISTPPVPDHQTRLAASALGVKVRRMIPDEKAGEQEIVVNIISYLDPSKPFVPWPGGGREGPVYRGTKTVVVPYALPPAARSTEVDLGGPKNRDD